MNWTVDQALDEVADAIEAGAAPLAIEPETREKLKSLFLQDFKNQHAAGAAWPHDSERVLNLARRIGKRAKLITIDHFALSAREDEEIDRVDLQVALRAAFIVCKSYRVAGRKAGPYCPGIDPPEGLSAPAALERLLRKIRQSGLEV